MLVISEAPTFKVREGASPSARGEETEKAKVHAEGLQEAVRQLNPLRAVKEPRKPPSNVDVGAPPSAGAEGRGRANERGRRAIGTIRKLRLQVTMGRPASTRSPTRPLGLSQPP